MRYPHKWSVPRLHRLQRHLLPITEDPCAALPTPAPRPWASRKTGTDQRPWPRPGRLQLEYALEAHEQTWPSGPSLTSELALRGKVVALLWMPLHGPSQRGAKRLNASAAILEPRKA